MLGLNEQETELFKRLNKPQKVQDYLDSLRINFERSGETCRSPRTTIKKQSAHCIEGAMLAAAIFYFHGHSPLLLDLKVTSDDLDHVVAPFKLNGRWGAVSKSNHSVLRYRDPVYLSIRELVMSYFHEYHLTDGSKTLRSYSKPFNMRQYDDDWIISAENLWAVPEDLDDSPHINILSPIIIKNLRRADKVQTRASGLSEWKN